MTETAYGRPGADQILQRIADLLHPPHGETIGGWAGVNQGARWGVHPVPWRQSLRGIGEELIRAAKVKAAAEMAGNKDLSGAMDERIQRILDGELCPLYLRIIKIPKGPYPPEPVPHPNWRYFEELVAMLTQAHAELSDGHYKQTLEQVITTFAGTG